MTQPNIAFFTPSMNNPALLKAIFTARHWLADEIMNAIRDSVESGSRHYLLLYGPRGIGKTHLVSLVYYRVKEDESLHAKLRIAWLQEDPYAVSSYARLLRAILSQLDLDYSLPGWKERLTGIENLDDTNQIERALEHTLLDYLGERVLLLLAENLDEIFAGLGDDGQKKLRAFLQTRNVATILATSTSLLPDLEDRNRPFFGFFKKIPLAQFTFQDCVDVLVRIAEFQQDRALAETLNSPQGRARIHAIHHLAGGNPRIYVMFYQFLSRESLDQLISPFMKLVDELMPYYQARMQTLSPQQRTLIDIIRRNESPIAVRDIAKSAFVTSQSASRELKTLRDLGYVESNQVGRESLYELREPLMRICLSAKEQRGQSLPLFVEFLRIWFTPTELKGMSNALSSQTRDYEMYRDAIEESRRRHDALISFERQKILDDLRSGEDDAALARLLSLNEHAPDDFWVQYELRKLLEARRDFDRLVAVAQTWTQIFPGDGRAWNELNYANNLAGNHEAALEASSRAIALLPNDPVLRQNHLVNLQNLDRPAELSEACAKALEIREDASNPKYWNVRAFCLTILNRWEEAADSFIKSLALQEGDYSYWRGLHVALEKLDADPSRAKIAEFAVELFPADPLAWRDYSTALSAIGKYKEALAAHKKAIDLAPNEENLKGEQLACFMRLNDLEGARSSLDHFEAWQKSDPDPYPLAWLAHFWLAAGDRAKAASALADNIDALKAKGRFGELSSPVAVVGRSKDPATWKPVIDLWIEVFEKRGELATLGPALVRGLMRRPEIFTPQTARDWTEAWQAAAGDRAELTIPLRMMDIGVRFMETGDRTLLLELPLEQRSLFEPEIDRYLRASGKLQTGVDREIDDLIENIRRKRRARVAAPVALPPKVDDARIENLLAAYDTERPLERALRPLQSGDLAAVPRESAPHLLRLLADSGTNAAVELSRPGLSILRLDQQRLEFAKGLLYQAHIDLNGRIGSLDFWSDGARSVLLDGKSPAIYSLAKDGVLQTTGEHELSYLVFFASTLRAEFGRFVVVWPADPTVVQAVRSKAPTLSLMSPVRKESDGKTGFELNLVYGDSLFRSVLSVDHERGEMVQMLEDELLVEELGLPRESFDGAIRFWAAEDKPKTA